MGVIFLMAFKTSLWSKLQVRDLGRAPVTLRAQRKHMATGQRKLKNIMVEIISIRIYPIVTIQTCTTKRQMVIGHKGYIALIMAIIAGF